MISTSLFERREKNSRKTTRRNELLRAKARRLCVESLESRRVLTDVSGTLSGNVTWTLAQSPIRLVGNVSVPAGATLTIQSGVVVNTNGNFALNVSSSGTGGTLNSTSATFNIDVNLGTNSAGTIQSSRWNTGKLQMTNGSSVVLTANSFHSGDTASTTPIWIAPNLTSRLDGSTFDAGSTQIGILDGVISTPVQWKKLPNVSGYRLLFNSDVSVNNGGSLTIASGNVITREGTLSEIYVGTQGTGTVSAVAASGESISINVPFDVRSSGTSTFSGVTFATTVSLAGGGSIQNSRVHSGRLELYGSSTLTLANNSFHNGDTASTTPVWIAPNLTARLDGSTFDAGSTQIGILEGVISTPVQWKKLPNVNGYRLLFNNDVSVNNGGSLSIASGNVVTREGTLSEIYVGTQGTGTVSAVAASGESISIDVPFDVRSSGTSTFSGVTFSTTVTLAGGGSIQNSRVNTGRLELYGGSTLTLTNNSFHSGDTANTTPIWIAPNLTSRLDGSTFDAGSTQIGILEGVISTPVQWKKLPNVNGYRLLFNNDVSVNNGGSLSIASGNVVTREGTLSEIYVGTQGTGTVSAVAASGESISIDVPFDVRSSGTSTFSGVTFSTTVTLAGGGSIQNSRVNTGRLELYGGSTLTLANNSFHSGDTASTTPVWIAPNLTSRLDGSTFDVGSTQIGILAGVISTPVQWKKLPNVDGYRLLFNNDVSVNNGGSLTIASGNIITREGTLSEIYVGTQGTGTVSAVAASGESISIDVPFDVRSSGTSTFSGVTFSATIGLAGGGSVQNSRVNSGRLEIYGSSTLTLANNSFHNGDTESTTPVWIAPHLTSRLDGSTFDAGSTQIGILAGIISTPVQWKKLPNVNGYRLLFNNDVSVNNGGSLTIASGNVITREGTLSEIYVGVQGTGAVSAVAASGESISINVPFDVRSSGTSTFAGVTFATTVALAGGGSIQNSRVDSGRLELYGSSTLTLANNSFHNGDTESTTPVWIAPNLTSRLDGSAFDAGSTQIGILTGVISTPVQWKKLPNVNGYRLLFNSDVSVNDGGSLSIASGNVITREGTLSELYIAQSGSGKLESVGNSFEIPVFVRAAGAGVISQNTFGVNSSLTIHSGSTVLTERNNFRNIPQVFVEGPQSSTYSLNGNEWGTIVGAEIEAKITHRPDTNPPSRPLATFTNPISPNTIGGIVWTDADADGLRGFNEVGVAGVTAKLRGAGVDGIVGSADDELLNDSPAVTTSATGSYQIAVPAAHVSKSLYVQFTNPVGTIFTIQNLTSAGDFRDSDADGSGRTHATTWFDRRVDFSIDAGLIALAPEIEVSLGGIDLFDGWSRVNYGQTEVGTPVSRTFVVTNVGNAPLTLSQPTFASGTGFTISQPLSSLSLAPGASTSFVATMTAQSVAVLNSRLQLMSNDGDEGSFDLTLLGEVKAAQSQADIRMLSVTSNGTATVTVQYEIAVANAPAFSVGVYRTENGLSLTGATLLDSFDITLPSELSVGTHTKSFTIGGNVNELAFPGLGAADVTNSDYRILFVADPSDAITEPDGNPLSEDNQSLFVGAYKAGTSLFVHGSDGPDSIQFAPSGTNHSLTINGGTPINYATSSITTVYLRTHAGNDTVQANTATRAMVVMGGEDNDTIDTGTAADVLIGNGGDDLLRGGSGNDTYRFDADENLGVDSLSDAVGLETLDFSDTASAVSINLALTSTQAVNGLLGLILDSPTTFDNIKGGAGNDQLFGNASANVLTGGAGNDQLAGVGGNDTYLFDADTPLGSDQLTDTAGVDTISFDGTTSSGVVLNLALTTAQVVNPRLTLALATGNSFENIIGGSGADTLTGNVLANQFTGGAGNDQLTGGAGNDTYLFDTDLALGTDTLNESGGGTDTLSFATTTTRAIAIDLGNSASQVVNTGLSLILGSATSFENVLGGSLADTITGNSLANSLTGNAGDDTLIGLDGADILIGNAGNDTLRGGLGDDSYLFDADSSLGADTVDETGGGGVDTLDYAATTTRSLTVNIGNSAQQTVEATNQLLTLVNAASSIENVIGGSLNDTLTGNDLDNLFKGNAGNDTITGGLGNDTYQFDVDVAQGNDTVSDADGIDMFDFSQSTAQQVTLDLSLASQAVNANLNLTLSAGTNIENAIGGSRNDTLIGNNLDNLLLGGAGNDTIRGGNGKDVLLGGAGNDVLEGGDAEDLLISGTTSFDANYSNLRIIQTAWSSSDPYQTRVNNLRAGVSGVALTAKTTVINSGTDSLRGEAGRDWFFAGLDDTLVDQAVDELNDVL